MSGSARAVERVERLSASFNQLAEEARRFHFAFLDLMLDLVPEYERGDDIPRSWEVEREDFMRGLTTDPRDEDIGE